MNIKPTDSVLNLYRDTLCLARRRSVINLQDAHKLQYLVAKGSTKLLVLSERQLILVHDMLQFFFNWFLIFILFVYFCYVCSDGSEHTLI